MRIAVIGGGLMGCSAALALAAKGARITLLEQDDALLQRTATSGEGKIHLGYVYANDRSLATARMMARGALAFATFFRRHLGSAFRPRISAPFLYAVHQDSLLSPDAVSAHLDAVHHHLAELAVTSPDAYFGIGLETPRRLSPRRLADVFDPAHVQAAFTSPEVAIDAPDLARAVAARIADDPAIDQRLASRVRSVAESGDGLVVSFDHAGQASSERFDHVVNAAWAGRLAIDRTMGLAPGRPWLFRQKYGIHLPPGSAPEGVMSTTFVLGPFGDVVLYDDGGVYLSWYPVCMTDQSADLSPPAWPRRLSGKEARAIAADTLAALGRLMPALGRTDPATIARADVRGGTIFAWGKTGIDDRGSELHRRNEIGITSHGRYHSVDPGKLTMAPWFAERCTERILA